MAPSSRRVTRRDSPVTAVSVPSTVQDVGVESVSTAKCHAGNHQVQEQAPISTPPATPSNRHVAQASAENATSLDPTDTLLLSTGQIPVIHVKSEFSNSLVCPLNTKEFPQPLGSFSDEDSVSTTMHSSSSLKAQCKTRILPLDSSSDEDFPTAVTLNADDPSANTSVPSLPSATENDKDRSAIFASMSPRGHPEIPPPPPRILRPRLFPSDILRASCLTESVASKMSGKRTLRSAAESSDDDDIIDLTVTGKSKEQYKQHNPFLLSSTKTMTTSRSVPPSDNGSDDISDLEPTPKRHAVSAKTGTAPCPSLPVSAAPAASYTITDELAWKSYKQLSVTGRANSRVLGLLRNCGSKKGTLLAGLNVSMVDPRQVSALESRQIFYCFISTTKETSVVRPKIVGVNNSRCYEVLGIPILPDQHRFHAFKSTVASHLHEKHGILNVTFMAYHQQGAIQFSSFQRVVVHALRPTVDVSSVRISDLQDNMLDVVSRDVPANTVCMIFFEVGMYKGNTSWKLVKLIQLGDVPEVHVVDEED
ncbi:hypothetical protein HDV05_005615 [Chytridiales sp. JEL 0842]|nr:hypothetical protein HDV05_005615 [Chytridiales sp. JEL 0842]